MKIAVLGAGGTIGKTVTQVLVGRGQQVRLVGRNPERLGPPRAGVEIVPADVATEEGCRTALRGADSAVYTLGLPYTKRDFAAYPGMMRACVAAARREGVRALVLITNVYSYGRPQARTVSENHSRLPCSLKGELRKQQEDILLAAHDSELRTLSLRLPNFYGPDARLSLTHDIFRAAARGRTANLLGPIDTRQELCFTPDVGPLVADLLERPEAFGEAYNFAGAGETTWRRFCEEVFRAAGQPVAKYRVAGPGMLRALGLFSTLMRELAEMSYLQTDPVILDDSKIRRVLPNLRKTPYEEGVRQTVAAYAREAETERRGVPSRASSSASS